jgi:hypothetical protein
MNRPCLFGRYTQQILYGPLNVALRQRNRAQVVSYFHYLKLLMSALDKLPSFNGTLYRGINCLLSAKCYQKGKKFVWWAFSSCMMVLGTGGSRTMSTAAPWEW